MIKVVVPLGSKTRKRQEENMTAPELLEKMAELEHERWLRWMAEGDSWTDVTLDYSDFSNETKECFRAEARKTMAFYRAMK